MAPPVSEERFRRASVGCVTKKAGATKQFPDTGMGFHVKSNPRSPKLNESEKDTVANKALRDLVSTKLPNSL